MDGTYIMHYLLPSFKCKNHKTVVKPMNTESEQQNIVELIFNIIWNIIYVANSQRFPSERSHWNIKTFYIFQERIKNLLRHFSHIAASNRCHDFISSRLDKGSSAAFYSFYRCMTWHKCSLDKLLKKKKSARRQWRIQKGAQQARAPSKFWSTIFLVHFCITMLQTKAQIAWESIWNPWRGLPVQGP